MMNAGKAKAKASASKAVGVASANEGKAKAQASASKAGGVSVAKSKPKAPAAPPQGRKRKPSVQEEMSRLTWRVRLSDGTSKGFKYTLETEEGAHQEAEKFLEANSA